MAVEVLPMGVSITYRNRRRSNNGIRETYQKKLYQVRVTWLGRREFVGRYESLTDAKHALTLAQADILRGVFTPPRVSREARKASEEAARMARFNSTTVTELSKLWIDHVRRMGRKESTIYTYQKRIDAQVLPALGHPPVDAVTPEAVQDWYDDLDQNHGNGVSRGAYMMLSGMFTFAAGKAKGQPYGFKPLVAETPCRVVGATKHKPVRPGKASDKVITDTQLAELAKAMPAPERLAVLLGGWQALRIGEVLGLQRRDVQGEWLSVARQLQSRGQGLKIDIPKTEAGVRDLPMFPAVEDALKSHLKNHVGDADDAPLFPRTPRGDVPLHPNVLRRHFAAAVKATKGVPDTFVFHGLRHTALTRLGQRGATLEELKKFAGHNDSATVQRYQHATRTRLASLVADLTPKSQPKGKMKPGDATLEVSEGVG